jgi:3-oxoacyl-[acyl-carrier-protein] synthase-3
MHSVSGVGIRGVGAAVPARVARTCDYELLSPEEQARFAKATGIVQRHIVQGSQCASDLCAFAADDILRELAWQRSDIGLLVLITQTPDFPVPATSIVLQDALGLPRTCICFDVNLGCSAFPYGLAIASAMMQSVGIRRGLLMIGDVSSKVCGYSDKSTWPLFGDAGSVTALELDSSAPPMHFHLMNDGAGKEAIIIHGGGLASRNPAASSDGERRVQGGACNLALNGADVFSFAIKEVPKSIERVLSYAGLGGVAVEYLVMHQANRMINETIRTKVGLDKERTLYTLDQYGNTSSASIPLTLAVHGERLKTGGTAVVSGFGVGLSWGSAVIQLPPGAAYCLRETDDVYSH